MSLSGKYAFATVMSLVLHMCILISCSSVLCVLMALGMFIFVKVIASLIIIIIITYSSIALISSSIRTCSVRCIKGNVFNMC